jgi:replicative DNA helicase
MDIDKQIFDKCVGSTELYAVLYEASVTAEMFVGEYASMYEYSVRFSKHHGTGPAMDAMKLEFPDYDWHFPPSEPLSYYIELLKKRHSFNLTLSAVQDAYTSLNSRDVDKAVDFLRDAVRRIEDANTSEADVDWASTAESRYEQYLELQKNEGIDGYTTPFPSLDEATQGFHDSEFILIVARQGIGKTWLTNIFAHTNINSGLNVLYFTKEMPSRQVARRFDALQHRLNYQDLRKGTLDKIAESKWKNSIGGSLPGNLTIIGEESGGVSHVASKIERYKPDIVYVDGMYLMDDDQRARDGWQRLLNISRDMKKLAKKASIPIICTVQFNRQADNTKGNSANISGGDIARDADVILGLFQDEDQAINRRMTLKVLKQREGHRPEIECDWDIGNMKFSEVQDSMTDGVSW